MSIDELTEAQPPAGQLRSDRAVAIRVQDVHKTFRIPERKIDSLKERVTHPFTRIGYRQLEALKGISFDVQEGEFFGIVGRNGSGKSTLLKIIASIYRADRGRIQIAGRLAPFIELGVGFNPDLTARENILLNGVLMGLSRREAQRRLEPVLAFAELSDFVDLKLKNYSSGMMVRLAFAIMVEADADVMLVDEVLAVGDAAFAQKCTDVFRDRQRAGKTIVLVTHDMSTVQAFCDRAMLIHEGEMVYIGDPEETALRYYRLNFAHGDAAATPGGVPDVNVKVVDAWLEGRDGQRIDNVEQDDPIRLHAVLEARVTLEQPTFGFHFLNSEGVRVFGINESLDDPEAQLRAGQQVRISATIANPLLPGRYFVSCWVSRNRTQGDLALHVLRLLDFVVYGTRQGPGVVSVEVDGEVIVDPGSAE